ncbi:MAG: helix-turn-helix transcriptional regulator [Flavobacteriales bacterium]|nr:helix-turn-helix transcriptional regulator [Flavobacteriales bacterium]MCC6938559.1 helix-turn-helix transcriptional regulator [Flavobacteriales bacterium]
MATEPPKLPSSDPDAELRKALQEARAQLERAEQLLAQRNGTPAPPPGLRPKGLDELTRREREVMHAVCAEEGEIYDHIADDLHIARGTLNSHLAHVFKKLELHCRTSLVHVWMKWGVG